MKRGNFNTNGEKLSLPPSELGKLPPHAVDLERAVLGAMLLEKEAYHEIAHILLPEAFYVEKNEVICQAIIDLYNRGEVADILTVTEELKRSGKLASVGGAHYVAALTERLASSAHMEFHMRIILQDWIKREIIRCSTVTIREGYDDGSDAIELLDEWEKNLMQMQQKLFIQKADDSESLYQRMLADNAVLTSSPGTITGVTTGFKKLDLLTSGWQKTDMVVVAARPGMGKTSFVMCSVLAALKAGKPVAVFTLEMSSIQLYKRLASQETDIPQDMILRQGMDPATVAYLEKNMAWLRKAPLSIDGTPGLELGELKRKARKLKREKKIELIVIDYLQLMSLKGDDGKSKERTVSAISSGVKALAKELDLPVIALSQLSRQTENRPGGSKRPQLSDLRDSGSIEQDADSVLFIYRPEYYGMTHDEDGNSTLGVADIIIAKNRHGSLETVTLKFIGKCVKFVDPDSPTGSFEGTQFPSMQPNDNFLTDKPY